MLPASASDFTYVLWSTVVLYPGGLCKKKPQMEKRSLDSLSLVSGYIMFELLGEYMSYGLNSLKGGYIGDYIGDYYRVY